MVGKFGEISNNRLYIGETMINNNIYEGEIEMIGMKLDEVRYLIKQKKERYIARQANYGRIELQSKIDLYDHRLNRPMPISMIRSRYWYGSEWINISKKAREESNGICQGCGLGWGIGQLAVHHKKEISRWIKESRKLEYVEEYESHGTKTRRPWHIESNLEVLCKDCHADKHTHMTGTNERDGRLQARKPKVKQKKKERKVRTKRWTWNLD